MTLRYFFIVGLLILGWDGHAEEIKTTYSISGSSAAAITVVKKASAEKEKLMRGYLFEKLAENLKQFPLVTSVEFDKESKGSVTTETYLDYWELKRSYPAMIHLSLPTSVTLMVRVEESYRKCKSPAEKAAGSSAIKIDYSDSDFGSITDTTVDCNLSSSVRIKGPYSVYGNFASSVNVDRLLKEKQTISYEVARDWSDKTTMKIDGRFSIESELFDSSLLKFLDTFNLKVAEDDSKSITRNNILVGIARMLRINNERVVE